MSEDAERHSRPRPTKFIGFDSAWANNPKAPGAICAVGFDGRAFSDFIAPELVDFEGARTFITRHRRDDRLTLIALDQSTVVVNASGMRPVERLAATLISWLGGGVQPSNTGRLGMFCQASPIWPFMREVGAIQEPLASRSDSARAASGVHLIEVYPALALASLEPRFFGWKKGPRYNPKVKTFKLDDFTAVVGIAKASAIRFGLDGLVAYLERHLSSPPFKKSDQDRLDSIICLIVAIVWRLDPPRKSALLGDLETGYMVTPISDDVRQYLAKKNVEKGLSIPIQ